MIVDGEDSQQLSKNDQEENIIKEYGYFNEKNCELMSNRSSYPKSFFNDEALIVINGRPLMISLLR